MQKFYATYNCNNKPGPAGTTFLQKFHLFLRQ